VIWFNYWLDVPSQALVVFSRSILPLKKEQIWLLLRLQF
jgi:hypothetical protein